MSDDDNTKSLVAALKFAAAVREALPIDEEAERMVSRLINQRPRGYVIRKLRRKA